MVKFAKLVPVVLVTLVAGLGPVAAAGLLWWPHAFTVMMPAVTVAMFASAWVGPLRSVQFPAVFIAGVFGIVVTGDSPLSSVAIVAVLSVGMGVWATAGLSLVAVQITTSIPFVISEPPTASSAADYAGLAAALLVAASWGIFLGWLIQRFVMKAAPLTYPVYWPAGVVGGLMLAIVGSTVTYLGTTILAGTMWAWLLLTFYMLVKSDPTFNLRKNAERVLGTLVGSVGAALVIALTLPEEVIPVLVVILMAVALSAMISKYPYWMYVTALTPAIVLMHSVNVDPVAILVERIGFTILGVALAIILSIAINFSTSRLISRESAAAASAT